MYNYLIMALLAMLPLHQYSQDFQGKAIYESKTTVKMDFSGRQMSEERKKQIEQRMKQFGEKTYVLTFNRTESLYKEEVRLDQPSERGGRGFRFGAFSGGGGDYYKNIQEGAYAQKNELFGKLFLIQDSLPNLQWKLSDEQMKIGEYTAYKATATKQVKRPNLRAVFRRGGDSDEQEFVEKEVEIVAWYAPEIPINQGPGEYWGLPGLILSVQDDLSSILCSKIVFNPEDKIVIKAPTKGKKVDQTTYDKISREKMKEMRENFRSNRNGRRNGPGPQ